MGKLILTQIGAKKPVTKTNTVNKIAPKPQQAQQVSIKPTTQARPITISKVVEKKKELYPYPIGTLSVTIADVDAAVNYLSVLTSMQDVLALSIGDERNEIKILKKTWKPQ